MGQATCPYCGALANVVDTKDEGRVVELVAGNGRLRHRVEHVPTDVEFHLHECPVGCLADLSPAGSSNGPWQSVQGPLQSNELPQLVIGKDGKPTWPLRNPVVVHQITQVDEKK